MASNPFQEGQAFAIDREKALLANEAAARKEKGINALGTMFGDAALAPAEFAAVTGSDRAERRLDSDLNQRDLTNERINEDRKVEQQERDRKNMLSAAGASVAFLKNAQEQGVDMAEAVAQIQPTLLALEFQEEDIAALPQILTEDPQAIAGLEALVGDLRAQGTNNTQRRVVKSENVEVDGKPAQRLTRADGSIEVVQGGGTPLDFTLSQERNRLAALRLDAEEQEILNRARKRGQKVGEAEGEIIAGDLPPGRRETEQGKILLEQRELKNDFLQERIDQAIKQSNGWTTGIFSGARFIGGTPQADLSATLDTIKANIGFEELQRMRDASPTGGALGQVSERENELLQSVWGSVAQSQSAEQLDENLAILKETVEASRERVAAAWEADFGTVYGGEGSVIPSIEGGDAEIDALLNKYEVQ